MNANTEGYNYFPFLTHRASTPTSSRTVQSTCGSDIAIGGQTTRGQTTRSLSPKNLHGNYEGDLSMFTSRTNRTTGSLMDQILEAGLDLGLDQHFDSPPTDENLDADTYEMVDDEIRAKIAETPKKVFPCSSSPLPPATATAPSSLSSFSPPPPKLPAVPPKPSMWQRYKGKMFSAAQCKKIDDALSMLQQYTLIRRIGIACKFAVLVISCVIRLLIFNVLLRTVEVSWNATRFRCFLRKCSRRLLWCMTLAKYGDLQFFGLVLLLSLLVFVITTLGFFLALYNVIKNGIHSFVRYIRHIELEVPQMQIED